MSIYCHHCKKCGRVFYSTNPADVCYKCSHFVANWQNIVGSILMGVSDGLDDYRKHQQRHNNRKSY